MRPLLAGSARIPSAALVKPRTCRLTRSDLVPTSKHIEVPPRAQPRGADVEMLEFVERHDEMPQVAPEPIERRDGDQIELPTACVGHERVEPGSLLARTRSQPVRVGRHNRPAGAVGMLVERAELVLGGLVGRADACVEFDSLHGDPPSTAESCG